MTGDQTTPPAVAFQVVFDAADPHAVARFWADALRYEKEDHGALVEQLVEGGQLPHEATTVDDRGRPAFAEVAACRDPAGRGPRLFFQKVPEPKVAKNRVHLDLHLTAETIESERKRIVGLGATVLSERADRGSRVITVQDVEGNELCLTHVL